MKAVKCSYQIRVKIGRGKYDRRAKLWVSTRIQSGNSIYTWNKTWRYQLEYSVVSPLFIIRGEVVLNKSLWRNHEKFLYVF